jgi:hypothetical protein
MLRILSAGLFAAAVAFCAGCDSGKKTQPTEFKGGHGHDHGDHDRKDAMLEDMSLPDGTEVHVLLQAHLDEKEGNEIDVFFEKVDKTEPFPIPAKARLTARVTREGDNEPKTLEFKPAAKDERKNDPDDKVSRYSAEAKWMKPDDKLTVVLTVDVDGKIKRVTFPNFVPKDKAHKHEH